MFLSRLLRGRLEPLVTALPFGPEDCLKLPPALGEDRAVTGEGSSEEGLERKVPVKERKSLTTKIHITWKNPDEDCRALDAAIVDDE
ncbi:hypothetical protein SERLA73DRAFT_137452 [Serpula lacrymans var. lacrymans S7.3]|uniref:Uncharacterized protein n=2 Tax=Serpula lacrymans var. lacrymans TaxID=341189 RepID=F8PZA6_SERL3|nr:uncharacterized protein SERLADRAFT_390589 [Serpula lacrymans var. lacrymans S7.9]EGN99219.1 hypothetical protein SERLA73DRAFT_137452 [Serpula lacrymans var. lacrymans S7.3]EGO24786.1 hypothetical protein SERLADRAFT_390589 [Serpula lacrymans var. lacrymans S7.9]